MKMAEIMRRLCPGFMEVIQDYQSSGEERRGMKNEI
jgi:hypothetical protein